MIVSSVDTGGEKTMNAQFKKGVLELIVLESVRQIGFKIPLVGHPF